VLERVKFSAQFMQTRRAWRRFRQFLLQIRDQPADPFKTEVCVFFGLGYC
jgi:hypothetical protein